MASLVCGVRRDMASSSWNAPRETRWVSEEPARRRRGNALALELPIWICFVSTMSRLMICTMQQDVERFVCFC